jgi:hypothetical protein
LAAACTTKGCDICFEPGHLNKRCNNTIRMLQSSCTRCEQFGHTDEVCIFTSYQQQYYSLLYVSVCDDISLRYG